MPFSFKPDATQEVTQAGQPSPQADFAASAQNLMERAKSGGKSFFEILLFALLGFLFLLAIGLLGYKYYLTSQIDAKKEKLAQYENRLAGLPIEDMRKLSNRLKVINQLVREHPSVNVAFLIVEASVENMVTFSKFDLRYSDTAKSYKLVLNGVAPDYKSLAQQMDAYKMKPYITYVPKINLENVQPDANGKIVFSISMPVTITGLIPETFSIVGGTDGTSVREPTEVSAVSPESGAGASSTLPAAKP